MSIATVSTATARSHHPFAHRLASLSAAPVVPPGEEVQFGPGDSHSVCLPAKHSSGLSGE